MNNRFDKKNGLIALMIGTALALSACAGNPPEEPASYEASFIPQTWPAEPEPVAEPMPMEAASEQSQMAESSGIAAPMQEEPAEIEPVAAAMPATDDLASAPAGYFAVQILATSKMDKITPFAQQYGLDDKLTAEINVNGKTWFVLILGVYPTLTEAKQAMTDVSGRLNTSPWIRTVGSLQNLMSR